MRKVKVKILGIHKRGLLARIFSIYHWKVCVSVEGEIHAINAWAGVDDPHLSSLLWNIEKAVRERIVIPKSEIKIVW